MDKQNILWQVIVKVYDELQVHHSFIALVYYCCVWDTVWVIEMGFLVDDMRKLAEVDIQP